eukprot:jgi/Phyca11/19719/fgenesh1_pg.PHYCAscaffold_51_\
MSEAFAVIDDGAGSPPPADEPSFTRLSVHQSHEDALAAMELVEGDRYLFLYNNGSRGHNAVYVCATHIACSKLMRLVRGVDDADDESIALEESGTHGRWRFALETSGVHTGNESEEKKSGIASALKRDVDSLLIGAGPAKCAKLLKQRYKDDAIRLRLMPDEVQLKNRGWEIKTPAALLEWVSGRVCQTAADFFGAPDTATFDKSVESCMDDLLVLRTFSHDVDMDGNQAQSFGIVFSSRKVFSNVKCTLEDQEPDEVLGAPYIVRARGLLSDSSNYLKLKRVGTTKVAAVVFNALEYATCAENPSKGVKVTEARMRKYIDSLDGKLVKNKPMTEAQLLYQSLYRVQVLNSEHDPFEVSPKWSADDSGWMCEHIVATMARLEKISIDALLSVLPVRRRPGA